MGEENPAIPADIIVYGTARTGNTEENRSHEDEGLANNSGNATIENGPSSGEVPAQERPGNGQASNNPVPALTGKKKRQIRSLVGAFTITLLTFLVVFLPMWFSHPVCDCLNQQQVSPQEGCSPGWMEHDSRCFNINQEVKTWEEARFACLQRGGDLVVVKSAEDQAFLINLTWAFIQKHLNMTFEGAWIGLQDLVQESRFVWVKMESIEEYPTFWMPGEPNNLVMYWDTDDGGQDCVILDWKLEPTQLNWWDDIICDASRHYICEKSW